LIASARRVKQIELSRHRRHKNAGGSPGNGRNAGDIGTNCAAGEFHMPRDTLILTGDIE
jgi:hypothetical protein